MVKETGGRQHIFMNKGDVPQRHIPFFALLIRCSQRLNPSIGKVIESSKQAAGAL